MILKTDTGLDLSHWEKGLQLSTLNPVPRFIITKATESTNYTDDTAADFARQSRLLGIPLGFYHFWRNVDPVAQADLYLNWVNACGGFERIPPVLDLEISLTGQANSIKIWLDRVEARTGKRPILYGRKDVFDTLGYPAWFKNYDAWVACYPPDPDKYDWIPPLFRVPQARRQVMWQYSEKWAYPEAPLIRTDTNIATAEFLQEIGVVVTPQPPIGGTMKEGTALVDLNIRSGVYPAPVIGMLRKGDKAYGELDPVSGWLHFNKILRVSGITETLDGWCSGAATYITIVDYVPTTPPVTTLPDLNITIQAAGYPVTVVNIKPL